MSAKDNLVALLQNGTTFSPEETVTIELRRYINELTYRAIENMGPENLDLSGGESPETVRFVQGWYSALRFIEREANK